MLLLGAAFEHADSDDGNDRHGEAQREAGGQRCAQVLMQLALAVGRRLLLRLQGAGVDRLDFGGDPHHLIAARHNLAAQKAVTIDVGRAVEQRRVRAPVFVELAPQLLIRPRIGFAQQGLELADQLFAFEVVRHEPRAILRRRRRGVEQVIARENARQMHARAHPPQPRLDVAIARIEAVEMRVGDVGFPLRGQNRDDDQHQKPEERDGHDRPRPKPHSADRQQVMFGHSLILPAYEGPGHPLYRGYIIVSL